MFNDDSKIYGLNGTRRREKKTTNDQYELYCNYIESHREILYKRMGDVTVQPLWDELTYLLNKLKGPGRDKRAWQRTFENWRNVTRFKCRKEGINDSTDDIGRLRDSQKLKELEIRALLLWNANYDYAKDITKTSDNELSFDGNFSDTSKPATIISVPLEPNTQIQQNSPNLYRRDPLESIVKSEIEIIDNYPAANLVRDIFPDVQPPNRNMGAQTQTDDTTLVDIGISIRNELKRLADAKIASLQEIKKQTDALNNMAEAIQLLANKKI